MSANRWKHVVLNTLPLAGKCARMFAVRKISDWLLLGRGLAIV